MTTDDWPSGQGSPLKLAPMRTTAWAQVFVTSVSGRLIREIRKAVALIAISPRTWPRVFRPYSAREASVISTVFTRSLANLLEEWWPGTELNRRHADFQSSQVPKTIHSQRSRKSLIKDLRKTTMPARTTFRPLADGCSGPVRGQWRIET